MNMKKMFIILISINTPDTMTRQHWYHAKKAEKSKKGKSKRVMKKIKKGYKKWLVIDREDYLKKEKIKKKIRKK